MLTSLLCYLNATVTEAMGLAACFNKSYTPEADADAKK